MITNNIFKAIGDFFTNVFFVPFEAIRFSDNWWAQSTLSWVFASIAAGGFIYWMTQIQKFKKAGTE